MTYNIQYHAIDGSDGGTTASGFSTIDEARIWAAANRKAGREWTPKPKYCNGEASRSDRKSIDFCRCFSGSNKA